MSVHAIRRALSKALDDLQPSLPTVWDNDEALEPKDYEQEDGYQRVALLMAPPLNPETGPGHQKRGAFQVTLCYPTGRLSAALEERADQIEKAFPRGATFTHGDTSVVIDGTADVMPGYRDGDRWCVPIRLTFWSNHFDD